MATIPLNVTTYTDANGQFYTIDNEEIDAVAVTLGIGREDVIHRLAGKVQAGLPQPKDGVHRFTFKAGMKVATVNLRRFTNPGAAS